MSKVVGIIQPQAYELIRERIGAILADEILNQYTLTSNADINAEVWVERKTPFDKTDFPAVNVVFPNGTFDNKNARSVDGTYTFNIDVYTSSKNSSSKQGDKFASTTAQKILGICRAILENPVYRTLDFAAPFICNTHVSSITLPDMSGNDADNTAMGRLVFSVRAAETTELIEAALLASNDTVMKLYLTDKGYKFVSGFYLDSVVWIAGSGPNYDLEINILESPYTSDVEIEFLDTCGPMEWKHATSVADGKQVITVPLGSIQCYTKARLNYNNGESYSNEITGFNGQS